MPYYSFRKHRFGTELRIRREILRLTLKDVQALTGLDDSTIARIETAKLEPSIRQFLTLCTWMDMKPSRYILVDKDMF